MIFEEIAGIMSQDTARRLSKRTGLSRSKIYRLSRGIPFMLDYETISALERLGYEIQIRKKEKKVKK